MSSSSLSPIAAQTQSIAEAMDLIAFAARSAEALGAAARRLAPEPEFDDERAWLAAAERRVLAQAQGVDAEIAGAMALPEFEAQRRARGEALFAAWVDAVEALLVGISSQLSPHSPLIEILFPHQKFDKLRRGGSAARAYLAEFERRRRTAYVVRVSGEPEYACLAPLFAQIDGAEAAFEEHQQPSPLTEDELASLRRSVYGAADALRLSLQQARLLAEAALASQPGLVAELGLDLKPKKRAARAASDSADPA